jgi:phage shock protein PspC (stress-responsive transcriptional regulator)
MCGPRCATIVIAMTETTYAPPPPDPGPAPGAPAGPPRPLYRDDDKVVAGVCAAVGRWTGTDPVLWRVVLGVLVFFGGAGLALYLAGWLLIPKAGQDGSVGERLLSGRRLSAGNVLALVALVLLGAILVDDGRGVAAVLVLALIAWLVVREQSGGGVLPAQVPVTASAATVPPEGPLPATWGAPAPPAAPRERSSLGPVTLALTALVAGVLMAVRLAGVEELTTSRILAVLLVVVGCGLVAGTVVGRARWLFFFPGLPLLLALAVSVAADGIVDAGVGERRWSLAGGAPTQSFELGAGEAILDLHGADTSGRVLEVDARVGLGHLLVLVPEGMTVRLDARVGLGEIDLGRGGDPTEGSRVSEDVVLGTGDVEVELDLSVGTGMVEVRRG